MTKKFTKIVLLAITALAISCSKSDDNNGISTATLTWSMDGQNFTAQGGKAYSSGDEISVNITSEAENCSSDELKFKNYLTIYIPKNVSPPYENTKANIVFNGSGVPLNALNNTYIVHSITDSEITISVKAETYSGNKAEGKYTIPYCSK